ncbi:MAG: hypothetical protein Q7S58_17320 [Candidatus Binatus sp.]|uniref:hypothetical protein n=1 Tax=Candidatus Binatus sp. TaxID=2811406 RepID=UPI00271B6FC6|nr:hypothetical protein [Candidatus Binatus sp.]MDO8434162.1 hypothetical protein [Candidatus Binatus sp.]
MAPVALHVVEGVGSGAMHVAESVIIGAHNSSNNDPNDLHPGENEVDRRDRCDRLTVETPGVIELRSNASGAPEYRELLLNVTFEHTDWRPLIDEDTDPDGWRPAVNFMQMHFAPPLDVNLPKDGSDYLAYATVEPKSAEEEDRLTNLAANFSPPIGTFVWNERTFQYVAGRSLPCFAAPGAK